MRFLLRFFGEDSVSGRFLNKLYIVVVSNLLFVLFSLPGVTVGAAICALDFTLMKLQRGDKHFKVAAMFWKGFKENFGKATLCFLGLAVLFAVPDLSPSTWPSTTLATSGLSDCHSM